MAKHTLHRLESGKKVKVGKPGEKVWLAEESYPLDVARRYSDGGGLWLQVSKFRTRSWLFQFTLPGRPPRWHGLGTYPDLLLNEARSRASALRKRVGDGIDPIEENKAKRLKGTTFKKVAGDYIKAQSPGWRNPKHRQQWPNTLTTYVYPVIGNLSVSDVDRALVLKILKPIWSTKPETADRVRGRIEKVLDYAKSIGARSGDNPAAWKGNLEHSLPKRSKVAKVKHHRALAYDDVPAFVQELRARVSHREQAPSALALEFTILTATRTGAVIGATWDEIDFEKKQWKVPPDRAGVKIEGNDPKIAVLSDRAIEILESVPREEGNPHVFIGGEKGKGLSNASMRALLQSMTSGDFTVHGFRSSFKDWAVECTGFENIVSEAALFHGVADKVEAAYRRGALLEKRKRLMNEWAKFCAQPRGKRDGVVTPLRKKESA